MDLIEYLLVFAYENTHKLCGAVDIMMSDFDP